MKTVPLRALADLDPPTPELLRGAADDLVIFMPLEAVWANSRLDTSRLRPRGEVLTGYSRFRARDVLCPKVAPTFQAGRSAVMGDIPSGCGAATTEVFVLRPRRHVDSRFIRYTLLSSAFLAEGVTRFQGVAGLQRVPADFVASFPVAAVEPEEQRRIADFLDDQVSRLDAAIEGAAELEQQAAERSQASLDALFDGSGRGPRCKELLAQFPQYGVLVPKLVDEGVPFIRIKDLADLQAASSSSLAAIPLSQSAEYRRTVVRAGDVLVGVVGSTDKAAIVPERLAGANIARAVARLVPAKGVPSLVLLGWLGTTEYRRQAAAVTDTDTAQPTLNMGDLRNFHVPLPAVSLETLVDGVEEVRVWREDADTAAVRLRQLLEERKRALITACVTGEFDVSTASSRAGEAAAAHVPAPATALAE